jgi:hypothetical protein
VVQDLLDPALLLGLFLMVYQLFLYVVLVAAVQECKGLQQQVKDQELEEV